MSRRRNRRTTDFLPGPSGQPQPPAPQFSRPVKIDLSKMDLRDLKTMAHATSFAQAARANPNSVVEADILPLIPELIDMLERVIADGIAGRPPQELWALVGEVNRQMVASGNPKN